MLSEGASGWTNWYFKVRGTKHSDLADVFLNYLLQKETQDRSPVNTLNFMARMDVAVPPQWGGKYPKSNEDYYKKVPDYHDSGPGQADRGEDDDGPS